jgi:hypothetical protein
LALETSLLSFSIASLYAKLEYHYMLIPLALAVIIGKVLRDKFYNLRVSGFDSTTCAEQSSSVIGNNMDKKLPDSIC